MLASMLRGGLHSSSRNVKMVNRVILVTVLLAAGCATPKLAPITLHSGMRVSRSAVFAPGSYTLAAPADAQTAAITVAGSDIDLDFTGVILNGAPTTTSPDAYRGIAICIENGRNITIRNLKARGYKIALLASQVESLHLLSCDFSYNYRPRLKSTPQKEVLSDWLSFHHNDSDEWLRYGAGIYLRNCDRARIEGCTVSGGQNGLLMTRCNDGVILNNNFSFNSGVGLGLYRSSRNTVVHNRMDWCIRGYSHGVYNRGQDSAGILVYEQSRNNTFAHNSATHSGDGFFLWAGQTTMDSGQGGCNDNVIAFNDFSHASNNGIEVTFSRNMLVCNRLDYCDYGIWAGYSFGTEIRANRFKNNRVGIAIEHGQDNIIQDNEFAGDRTGIKLWQNPKQDQNWGYPKQRDTRSRNYIISGNRFTDVAKPLDIVETTDVIRFSSQFPDRWELGGVLMPGGVNALLPVGHPRGRRYILMGEWGPYDFKSPKLGPMESLLDGRRRFEILGPPGEWRLLEASGVESVSVETGPVPGEITVTPQSSSDTAIELQLDYVGSEVISTFGDTFPAGQPYRFGSGR